MNLLDEMVHTVLLTGSVQGEHPLSLMIIAPPESGKTSIAGARAHKDIAICSDITGNGLVDILLEKPKAKHLIINDMIALMAHKDHVNKRTTALLTQAIEEGLDRIAMPGQGFQNFNHRRIGFICCIPASMVNDNRMWWNRSGFASRLLPFNYDFDEKLVAQIKRDVIVSGAYEMKNGALPLSLPRKSIKINIPEAEAEAIQNFANSVARTVDAGQGEERGLRRGKQLRALCRAHALKGKRNAVGHQEIEFLGKIMRFISYSEPGVIYAEKPNK